jgi:hypothetical protein
LRLRFEISTFKQLAAPIVFCHLSLLRPILNHFKGLFKLRIKSQVIGIVTHYGQHITVTPFTRQHLRHIT